ncbi:MAG: glycosyltransferase [Thauera sp.]
MNSNLPTHPILSFDFNTFMEHGSMMSREHVLLRLAKNHLIIHSTPPSGREVAPKNGGLTKIAENLYHYTNPRILPKLYRPQFLVRLVDRLRSVHRRRVLTKLGGKSLPILYIWHPEFAPEIDRYDRALTVYHIYDDYPTLNGIHPELEEKELTLLKKADLVFVINKSLIDKKRKLVDREYIHLPQAVDFELFELTRKSKAHVPTDISRIKTPRLGYIGRINEKVDLDLTLKLALKRRDWSFVFVGPVNSTPSISDLISRLKERPNVHFLGTKEFSQIANYWNCIDVAIVPYRVEPGQWAHFGSPLKLREAFAAGKPVVSTPLSDVQEFEGLALTASTVSEWEARIEESLARREDTALKAKMLDLARQNSWTARTEMISRIIQERIETL